MLYDMTELNYSASSKEDINPNLQNMLLACQLIKESANLLILLQIVAWPFDLHKPTFSLLYIPNDQIWDPTPSLRIIFAEQTADD